MSLGSRSHPFPTVTHRVTCSNIPVPRVELESCPAGKLRRHLEKGSEWTINQDDSEWKSESLREADGIGFGSSVGGAHHDPREDPSPADLAALRDHKVLQEARFDRPELQTLVGIDRGDQKLEESRKGLDTGKQLS